MIQRKKWYWKEMKRKERQCEMMQRSDIEKKGKAVWNDSEKEVILKRNAEKGKAVWNDAKKEVILKINEEKGKAVWNDAKKASLDFFKYKANCKEVGTGE